MLLDIREVGHAARDVGVAPLGSFGQQHALHVGENVGDRLPGHFAGRVLERGFARFRIPQPVAAQHADDAVVHVAPTDLDDHRRALANVIPALLRCLAGACVEKDAQRFAQHGLAGQRRAQRLAIVDQRGVFGLVA